MPEWLVAGLTAIGSVTATIIAGKATRRTSIDAKAIPAYTDLVDEVRKYRKEAIEDRTRIDDLEEANRSQSARIACLEKRRDHDRSWIRRTIERIENQAPEHLDLLHPLPDWHATD